MIRIGLLGAAKIAPKALFEPVARRKDVKVTALACRDVDRGRAFAKDFGVPHLETDYGALVRRSDVDLVYNALPPSRHADLSIAAIEAGKAVLCEKPFAMNSDEAERMAAAAAVARRPLVEAFHYRYHPVFSRILALLADGAIGAIRTVEARFTAPIPFREDELRHMPELGGGALMDLGCYPVHWARTVVGEEPRVMAAVARTGRPGVDIDLSAELHFPSGVKAKIHTAMTPEAKRVADLSVRGVSGALHVVNPLAPQMGHEIRVSRGLATETIIIDDKTTYDHQLAHMIEVMEGRAAPLTGGADAVFNMRAIDAIYRVAGLNPRGRS